MIHAEMKKQISISRRSVNKCSPSSNVMSLAVCALPGKDTQIKNALPQSFYKMQIQQ